MKKKLTKTLAVILATTMLFAVIPLGTFMASAITLSEYTNKYTAFINDTRWANNISWGALQTPKLSSWGSQGCCAYAADFEYYIYGTTGWKGAPFYSANQISTGSILHINHSTDGEHWIVVLERNGNSLYTAEGNYASRVNISRTTYRVYNGYLQQSNYGTWRNYDLIVGLDYSITSGYNPTGVIDNCVGQEGSVRITGWAFDADDSAKSLGIHVYIGGPAGSQTAEGHAGFVADTYRDDVNRAYGISGNHGYDLTVRTNKIGSQTVYVYALNVGNGQNTLIGTADINISKVNYKPKVSMYNGHIYEIYSAGISWTEAKQYCENRRGGHLMTVNNSGEHDFIKSQLKNTGVTRYYIGGTDEEKEGEWRWVTGEPFTYTCWGEGEPNGGRNQNHLIFITSTALWDDYSNISGSTGFICEIETENFTLLDSIEYQGHTYELYNYNLTYEGAEQYCKSKGGHLVSVANSEEQSVIHNMIKNSDCSEYCWIGAQRIDSSDMWIWEDGTIFSYSNWFPGQPDNWQNEENKAEIYKSTGGWNDVRAYYGCDDTGINMCFILEKDISVTLYIPGDINGDGEVDNKDLTRLFQYLSNWEVGVSETALDINRDSSVDNKDLTRLFQYLSNWDVEIF